MSKRVGARREMRKHVIIPTYAAPTQTIIQTAKVWESKLFVASVTLNVSLLTAIAYYIIRFG